MHYVTPPIQKKILDPKTPSPSKKNYTKDNFYEVQITKHTKTLYKTETIRYILLP